MSVYFGGWASVLKALLPQGSSTKMARLDIIAGSKAKVLQYAIEGETTRKERLYIAREAFDQLIESFLNDLDVSPF